MSDLISVIVPVYNSGDYLDRCINSILAQDYSPLEIVIVDDGSTDAATVAKCDELGRMSPDICVVHKRNGGLSSARNFGIEQSHGVYIGFVDSDDAIEADMYSALYKGLVQNKVKVAMGGISTEENNRIIDSAAGLPSGLYDRTEALRYLFLGYWQSVCTNLYERTVFDSVRFPEGEINEDYILNYQVLKMQDAIWYDGKAYYHYIKRQGSITSSAISLKFNDWLCHTSLILAEHKDDALLKDAALYQYLFSNIVLGNKSLMTLAAGYSADAETLYGMVTLTLKANRAELFRNRYISIKHRTFGLLMAFCPMLYKLVAVSGLRMKFKL
ncbi:MAG: glycosyltransferase family 2 protein [Bacteroidales bacterium]|nr:glycosyltransferase family 2 protein [Bacteroidales bacterium]